jgi:hypothetical protein
LWCPNAYCGTAPVGAVLAGLLSMVGTGALAEEESREFAAFRRNPAVAAQRLPPPDALEWEKRLRVPTSFGPYVLRPADATLLAAARAGNWPEVTRLVKTGGANPNSRDEEHGHVLVLAARAGADDAVRLLVQSGALLERTGEDGFTALGAAAFFGHRSTARILIKAGADFYTPAASGQMPLHLAASAGRLAVIDELMDAGADARRPNRDGENALDVAANRGQLDAMARFIAAGVTPAETLR